MYMQPIDIGVHSPRKACVFCNGPLSSLRGLKKIVEECDVLIAADGGFRYISELGCTPQVIIGDMDSVDKNILMAEGGSDHLHYPTEKDKTDGELAVEHALLDHKCEQVVLVAATGGRLDHTLGNIALAAHYPGKVALAEGDGILVAVDKTEKCILRGEVGTLVSLIPYCTDNPRVWTKGLKYTLENEPMVSVTHGLSNMLAETEACVTVSGGILMVYIENHERFIRGW
ncbi:thiamine diphosphokinase [Planctomycetota bacterium]